MPPVVRLLALHTIFIKAVYVLQVYKHNINAHVIVIHETNYICRTTCSGLISLWCVMCLALAITHTLSYNDGHSKRCENLRQAWIMPMHSASEWPIWLSSVIPYRRYDHRYELIVCVMLLLTCIVDSRYGGLAIISTYKNTGKKSSAPGTDFV